MIEKCGGIPAASTTMCSRSCMSTYYAHEFVRSTLIFLMWSRLLGDENRQDGQDNDRGTINSMVNLPSPIADSSIARLIYRW